MYVPKSFTVETLSRLHELMERESFALLISQGSEFPFATHLPFTLDRSTGSLGSLRGHLARANPQWKGLSGQPVLTVFSGPHCYVSPTWYESDHVVPTWNYVAVHAVGRFEIIGDRNRLREIVRLTTDTYEHSMPTPWRLPDGEYYDQLLSQIVGFEIVIESIEGKWKLSQNHSEDRQRKVVARLREHGGHQELAIAELMERNLLGNGALE